MYKIKKVITERDILIGIGIFGIFSMVGDLLIDLGYNIFSAATRGIGLILLVFILAMDFLLNRKRKDLSIPLMFTEIANKSESRNNYNNFVQSFKKLAKDLNVLEKISKIDRSDLVVRLDRDNPRYVSDKSGHIHENALDDLLKDWEDISNDLAEHFTTESYSYHIVPQIKLPLAFALGASINLRKSVILYHHVRTENEYYNVIDLTNPRKLFDEPEGVVKKPKTIPENLNGLEKGGKLNLHIIVNDRHEPNFEGFEDHNTAGTTDVAIIYPYRLNPEDDWLPYVQQIYQKAKPLINSYDEVEICMITLSTISFALGMAFSRDLKIKICDHIEGNMYCPVIQLSDIESKLLY